MCPDTTICVPMLLYILLLYVSSYYNCICVLIILYLCSHTTVYVSSYYYIGVRPHTTSCVILLCVCPNTTICAGGGSDGEFPLEEDGTESIRAFGAGKGS